MTGQFEDVPITERIARLRAEGEEAIAKAPDTESLEEARIRYLGRKAELPNLLRHVGQLDSAERAATGAAANEARQALEVLIDRRSAEAAAQGPEARPARERVAG